MKSEKGYDEVADAPLVRRLHWHVHFLSAMKNVCKSVKISGEGIAWSAVRRHIIVD